MTLNDPASQALCRRLETAEGHLRGVRRMVGEGSDCESVLAQLAAVRSALDRAISLVVREHLQGCMCRAIEGGDRSAALRELESISRYFTTSAR